MTDAEFEAMAERAAAAEYEADSNILWSEASPRTKDAYREGMRAALTAIGAREMMEALNSFAIYTLEGDESYVRLTAGGRNLIKHRVDSREGVALIALDARIQSALAKARGGQ